MNFVLYFLLLAALALVWKLINTGYITPIQSYRKLRKMGFGGPAPSFPMGNLAEMKKLLIQCRSSSPSPASLPSQELVSHDIHSSSLPYFAHWQKLYGKVFVYWMGVEPFLYVAEPELIKQMSRNVIGKNWGKPDVFRIDRMPMFGKFGLNMIEGSSWVRHRHIITPAFSSANLKGMINLMAESASKIGDHWSSLLSSTGKVEVDMEREITALAGEIIAKTNFGISDEVGNMLFDKLRAMQISLFKHRRYHGVPLGQLLCLRQTLEARRLGEEIDKILLSIINARRKLIGVEPQHDLLGLLLEGEDHMDGQSGKKLTTRELIDECKTFFFGGHETVALAMTWTMVLLAINPKWQHELREEIRDVIGESDHIDFTNLARLNKMGWVMNEVLRLYPSSPNLQRQARGDIKVGDMVIPNGTNIWIDVVGMHHDQQLWGDDVNEFKPERFNGDLYGGCNHKIGYLPFGFGGRMCVGRNYAIMEYKIVMSCFLRRFSFSISPSYRHSPSYCFSFRPNFGVPLIIERL